MLSFFLSSVSLALSHAPQDHTNLNIHLYKLELIRAQSILCALYFASFQSFLTYFFLPDLLALCYALCSLINVKHIVTLFVFK